MDLDLALILICMVVVLVVVVCTERLVRVFALQLLRHQTIDHVSDAVLVSVPLTSFAMPARYRQGWWGLVFANLPLR